MLKLYAPFAGFCLYKHGCDVTSSDSFLALLVSSTKVIHFLILCVVFDFAANLLTFDKYIVVVEMNDFFDCFDKLLPVFLKKHIVLTNS